MDSQELVQYAKLFHSLLDLQGTHTFVVTDLEKYLYVNDGLGLGIHKGEHIKEGSGAQLVIASQEKIKHTYDQTESAFHKEYTLMGVPIFDNNEEICGAIVWATSSNQFKLAKMSQELLALSEELSATSEEFARNAMGLSEVNQGIVEQSEALVNQMKTISEVNDLVTELSMETHFLGINAAIESAKAGEHGVGFSVVAEEIRRLARESKRSAKEISSNISLTGNYVQGIFDFSKKVAQTGEEQSAGAQELASAIQHVTRLASSLNDIANIVSVSDGHKV